VHSIAVAKDLRTFFNKNQLNTIEFWDCPSDAKWPHHMEVDKETKCFNPTPLFPTKESWDFSKKAESDDIIKTWQMTFQALDAKGTHFLELLDNDLNIIEPTYTKGGSWINHFGSSNSLSRAIRAITNHASIGEYQLRFFPRENFACPC